MAKVIANAKATLPENGVPDVLLKDLAHDTHLDKIAIQKHATTVLEPTSNLHKIADNLRTGIPNAVTMEKSSMDCTDYNTMFHNALENIKQKVRTSEAAPSTNVTHSYFARVTNNRKADSTCKENSDKHTIDIREFFTAAAERDNILALSADFFNEKDHVVHP